MEKELIILIEKRSEYIEDFLELITLHDFISFGKLRKEFPNTTAHHTIQNFVFKINESIKSILPQLEVFSLDIIKENGKVSRGYKAKNNIRFESTLYHHILIIKYENNKSPV